MIEELRSLEVDWSMEKNIELLGKALALLKGGAAQKELYSVVKQKLGEAEEYYDRPLDSMDIYRELAEVARSMGDDATASRAQKQINRYKANDIHFLGYQQAFYGNNLRATQYYQQALDLSPDHPLATVDIEKSRNRVDKSHSNLDKLRTKAGSTGAKKDIVALGQAYLDLGQVADAIKTFEEALSKDTGDVNSLARLGNALASEGKYREANKYIEKALELNPKSLVAKRGKNYVEYALENGG
ncbi:MAG: tetratricopeptide repeat protein [Candidatus Thermoplasmatota archaeon]|nr:tetratricopeptide repeat protein [Candidatus Thermoplasmatota archaeon]